jgi:phosphatidylglycerophosphate synthase
MGQADRTSGGAVAFIRRVESMRRRYTRAGALSWSFAVNYRIGALFAVILLPRRSVSPSAVTVSAMLFHIVGALFVLFMPVPATLVNAVVLLVIWQIAYSLDCADGLLARARSQTSAFGAWLDQVGDFVGHASMFTALAIFVSRALSISGPHSAGMAGLVISGTLLYLFASSQRNSIMGTEPATKSPPAWLRLATRGQHLADYGLWLFAASILLLFPRALLISLLAFAVLSILAVCGQVTLNWRAQLRGP